MKSPPLLRRPVVIWAAVTAFALGAPVLATTQAGPLTVSVTTSPNPYAIEGTTSVTKSVGLLGYGTGTTDVALEGYATQPGSTGLEGFENATSGTGNGVFGYAGSGTGVYGVSNDPSGYGVFGDNTGQGVGVEGVGNSDAGVFGFSKYEAGVIGESTSSAGTTGLSTSGNGVSGESSSAYGVGGLSTSSYGVYGYTSASQSGTPAAGVAGFDGSGVATGVYGSSKGGYALYGVSTSGTGAYGVSTSSDGVEGTSSSHDGVYGQSTSSNGVEGQASGSNASGILGECLKAPCSGVDGDTEVGTGVTGDSSSGDGVSATSEASAASGSAALYADATSGAYGGYIEGNSSLSPSGTNSPLVVVDENSNTSTTGYSFQVENSQGADLFRVTNLGSTYSANALSSGARDSSGAERQMFAPRATEALTEDSGEARLVDGNAYVALDPTFADILGRRSSYIVFITPEGDTAGLYVTQKSPKGFVVREHGGAHSSLDFAYRIVGHPANEKPEERMAIVAMPPVRPSSHRLEAVHAAQHLALLRSLANLTLPTVPRPVAALPKAQHVKRPLAIHVPPMPFVYRPGQAH